MVASEAKLLTRAIALPVERAWECQKGEWVEVPWKEACQAFHSAWRLSTNLAVWGALECLRVERAAPPSLEKLGPTPTLGLYTRAFVQRQYPQHGAWEGTKGSASSILRRVEERWRKARYPVLWRGDQAPDLFRYPQPFPIRRQEVEGKLSWKDGKPIATLPLPGRKLTLELRAGREFRRQLSVFRGVVEGKIQMGELALYRQRTGASCRRASSEEKAPGGGATKHYRIMLKIVYKDAPRPNDGEETLLLRTDPNAFLLADVCDGPGDPAEIEVSTKTWILNADHLKRWIAEHRDYLQRMSEDTKHEKRWPTKTRRRLNEGRDKRCLKQRNRLKSWIQQAVALVVKYAQRRRVGLVVARIEDAGYLESFPWHQLKEALAHKMEEHGIQCEIESKRRASGKAVDETPEPAREE